MALTMILTGDVNMMNVADPAVPFRRVGEELRQADVVFGNLECCLTIPHGHSVGNEGFFADPVVGGESERTRKLRQAISIAIDQEELPLRRSLISQIIKRLAREGRLRAIAPLAHRDGCIKTCARPLPDPPRTRTPR